MLSPYHILRICFFLLLGCLSACRTGPHLKPTAEGWANREAWLNAPVILVGTVTAVHGLNEARLQASEWSADVTLERIHVRLERFLRGQEDGVDVFFYRYGLLRGQLPGNVPLDSFHVGERRIFFLVRENGVLRTAVDIVASSFQVFSGVHADPPIENPHHMPRSIAEILVLPGTSLDEHSYVNALGVQAIHTVPL